MKKYNILLGLTGSIACFKSAALLSELVKAGHAVKVVATESALQFIGVATLEGLSRNPVHTSTFQNQQMMDHIHLARWSDMLIVAPITATHINKFAGGIADDLLTTLFLAYEKTKPIYIAPAMNKEMYSHFTVQKSLHILRENGIHVLEPNNGMLACGEEGYGRMVEPSKIMDAVIAKNNKKILVTFGGTRERIDSVRCITNTSTGQTGSVIADTLSQLGYQVTALCAEQAIQPKQVEALRTFTTHQDLDLALQELLSETSFDAVIHCAAVSDFTVSKIFQGQSELKDYDFANIKLSSDANIKIELTRTDKIVSKLKNYSKNPNIKVVAFKLTNTNDSLEISEAINKLFAESNVDCVVHNNLPDTLKNRTSHQFNIFDQNDAPTSCDGAHQLTHKLHAFFNTEVQP